MIKFDLYDAVEELKSNRIISKAPNTSNVNILIFIKRAVKPKSL